MKGRPLSGIRNHRGSHDSHGDSRGSHGSRHGGNRGNHHDSRGIRGDHIRVHSRVRERLQEGSPLWFLLNERNMFSYVRTRIEHNYQHSETALTLGKGADNAEEGDKEQNLHDLQD